MKAKQVLFTGTGQAEYLDYEVGTLQPDEVLIENDYTVISAGTEKANLLNLPNVPHAFPKLLGYSGCGHIIKTGAEVTDVHEGDPVLTDHLGHCSHVRARFRKNADGYYPIRYTIDPLDAAFVVIGSMGVQGARKTRLQAGETAMVTGLGILGMFALQMLSCSGGLPVIAVDLDPERLNIAKKLGADEAISPMDPEFLNYIRKWTGNRMIQANVEVTGSAKALKQALSVAAPMGRIALTGCTRVSDCPIDFYSEVHKPGIQLIGAHNYVRPQGNSFEGYWTRDDDFDTIMGFMERGKMTAKPLIHEVVSPKECNAVYRRLCERQEIPLGVVFDWHH